MMIRPVPGSVASKPASGLSGLVTCPASNLVWKELSVDVPKHLVTVKGKPVDLTITEFKLLTVLVQRRGRVQSRDQLLRDVWDYENVMDTRTVDTHMRRLREKIGPAAKYLDTVRGVGYRFVGE